MKYTLENQETERLQFRLVQKEDFDMWLPLFENVEVVKALGFDTSLLPKEICKLWFDKTFERYKNGTGGLNALIDKNTNEFVGQCGLLIQTVENEQQMEIGYSILPKFWRKGYAFEAANKCKNYAFENNWSNELISIIYIENIGSEKVALKNGMKLEKHLESYKGIPVNIFIIEKKDWDFSNFPI